MILQKVIFYITYALLWLLAWLPLRVLYLLSDVLFVLIYGVFRYRRKIVSTNLSNAFPEKTEEERKRIAFKFYRHFCDYIVETINLVHISEKGLEKRVLLDSNYLIKKSEARENTVGMMGHSGNWEWLSAVGIKDDFHWVASYHPLRNSPDFDRFIAKLRGKFGAEPVPMNQTYRHLMKINKEGGLFLAGLIADQSPPNARNRHWITFLNQDTAVMEGPERIAKKTGASVFFVKMIKIKRGYYKLDYVPITDKPQEEEDLYITQRYYEELEKQIREQPECWLWTHRRWKRQRPADEKLIKK